MWEGIKRQEKVFFSEKTLIKTRTAGRRDNMRKEKEAMWDTLSIQAKSSQAFFHDTKEEVARLDV